MSSKPIKLDTLKLQFLVQQAAGFRSVAPVKNPDNVKILEDGFYNISHNELYNIKLHLITSVITYWNVDF